MTVADHGPVARRALPYAVSLLALAAVAGCTASSPPSAPSSAALTTTATATSATTSQAPTPTATPTVDPAVAKIPAAARPETMAGAEAFARYYVTQINAAFTAPDKSELSGLSASTCGTCDVYQNTAADFEAKRQRQKTPLLQVTSATASKLSKGKATVNVFFNQLSVDVVNSDGTAVGRTSAGKGAFVFTLSRDSDQWTVSELKAAAS